MKLENLSTSKKRVLFYLIYFDRFTNLDVMKHSYWTKFCERLGELENELGYPIADRKRVTIIDAFGSKTSVMTYKSIDKKKLEAVFGGRNKMFLHMAMLKQSKKKSIQDQETIEIDRPEIIRETLAKG